MFLMSWVLHLLCWGKAHALGLWQQWTDNSKTASLILEDVFILCRYD